MTSVWALPTRMCDIFSVGYWFKPLTMALQNTVSAVAFTTTIVISMISASQEMKKHVAELEAYMEFRRLPMPMRRTLRECYARKWESHKYFDENSVLASLNAHTRKQVLAYTMNRALLNLPFLRQTSERFRNKLVFRMKEHTYPSGHLIAQGNTDASELRIILHGAVEFRDFNDNVVLTFPVKHKHTGHFKHVLVPQMVSFFRQPSTF